METRNNYGRASHSGADTERATNIPEKLTILVANIKTSSHPTFSERIMKTYFCILIAICIVLQTVQAAEMGSRARRQSGNVITLHIPKDLLNQLLEALLGQEGIGDILKNIFGNGGGN
ncbi:uncharacterized protein TNIN_161831 [Trichonephila inaurata madagascariensis]|uniref:Uncharacterized protein n=1 Tax=Trichonephila inaurata madagascariensis TaxID=2747483 RepID=A0A8X6YRJ7_9ARAC|nr:uncharacterized protein TNIN_161831 [Trichonephila inaurata madagascariensis]